jgi:hypothetical protein
MADPFRSAKRRIVRAQDHFHDLERQWEAFVEKNPYAKVVESNADGTREIHKIKLMRELPESLGDLVSDAADALRSALDLACYAVARAFKGGDPKCTHFPFADTVQGIEHTLTKGRSKDIPPDIAAFLRTLKPYKGGNDRLWALNRIRNTSQHKLITPVGLLAGDVGLLVIENVELPRFPPEWDSEKNEMVLFATLPGMSETDYKFDVQIRLTIAFGEVEIIAGEPVFEAFPWYIRTVEQIVAKIESESRRIGLIT